MLLEDLETYFTDKSLTTGYSVGKDFLEDSSEPAIGLAEYSGLTFGQQISGAARFVQVRVADKSAKRSATHCQQLFDALASDDGIVNLTPERWAVINYTNTPFKLEVDTRGRSHYAFNIEIVTYLG